jgi:hypothetical protein
MSHRSNDSNDGYPRAYETYSADPFPGLSEGVPPGREHFWGQYGAGEIGLDVEEGVVSRSGPLLSVATRFEACGPDPGSVTSAGLAKVGGSHHGRPLLWLVTLMGVALLARRRWAARQ